MRNDHNFAYETFLFMLLRFFYLRHGTDGFTSPPKKVVLRIFITLKTPSTKVGIEPATLGPVASTLTTSPPRATPCLIFVHLIKLSVTQTM